MRTYIEHMKGVTIRELYSKSNRKIIDEIVRVQVKIIDASILIAHSSGFNYIEHELPVNFNINNLDKADAQTMVYSEILLIYTKPEPEGKGFENIHIDVGLKPVLQINWLNGMDDMERSRRIDIIRKHMKSTKMRKKSANTFPFY